MSRRYVSHQSETEKLLRNVHGGERSEQRKGSSDEANLDTPLELEPAISSGCGAVGGMEPL